MISTQALVINLNETEQIILDNALEVIEEIVCHLELNRNLGLNTYRYELNINSNSFWKIMNYCCAINADEKELKKAVGDYGN